MSSLMQTFGVDVARADTTVRRGDRVRYKRPGSSVWREGTVVRYSTSRDTLDDTANELVQVRVDTVDGRPLRPPSWARIRASRLERVGGAI